MKIEGVRMKRSRWVAEIKHPQKKNVKLWLGSYATQEEASKAYQSKKIEHEKIQVQGSTKDKKLFDDQEIYVAIKDIGIDDQAMEFVDEKATIVDDFNDQRTGNGLEESKAEALIDDHAAFLFLSKQQQEVPVKIKGVRMRKSRWIAEIKHPKKKNFKIWLGSYATQGEASKVYQAKKMELEKVKLRAIAGKEKLVDGKEVVSAKAAGSNAESLSDNPDVMMNVIGSGDQATKVVDVLKEPKAESQSDDRDVMMHVVDFDDQARKVFCFDDRAESSLSRGRVAEQEVGNMLLHLGPILIDRHGHLLGEFRWIDDLRIV